MSNKTITANVAGKVGPTGRIETDTHTHHRESTITNTTVTRNTATNKHWSKPKT
jgi:hypothetical protein